MNKRLLTILVLVPTLLIAAERSMEQAAAIAQQFMHSQSPAHRAPANQVKPQCVYTQSMPNLEREAFYVFNNEDKGFVIVSAETNAPEIIGYSDENTFGTKNLPSHIQAWFDYYAQQLEWLAEHPTVKAFTPSKTYTPIDPLLKNIEWGQDEPYNNMCPIMPGEKSRSVTGCAATAMAQIMGYYQWPKHSRGQHSLPYDRSKEIDYDKDGEYDWDNILLGNYYYTHTTSQQDAAIAKLMWHVGVACDMQYSANGSGASEVEMARRSIQHFDYDSTMQEYYLDYMGAQAFTDLLNEQLTLKQPCLVTGFTTNWEGHGFVCDGINAIGKVHINWGWDGVANGYFYVTLLDPNDQGTGGSASNLAFTQYVAAVVNIKPNAHGKQLPNPIVTDSFYYDDSKLVIGRNEVLYPALKGVYAVGLWDEFHGDVGLGIYKDGQFMDWLYVYYTKIDYWGDDDVKSMSGKFPKDLPNGEYELYPAYRGQGYSEKLRAQVVSPNSQVHLEVTDDQIIINGGIDLTMSNFKEQVGELSIQFNWESQAPYFRVEIASEKGVYVDEIINQTQFTFTNDSVGVYTYTITPLREDKQPSVWEGQSGEVFLSKIYPITNLQCTGENFSVVITWESEAPKFRIEVTKGKKSIATGITNTTSTPLTYNVKGTYTFSVTPLDESEIHAIGETQTMDITLPFQGSDLFNLYKTPAPLKQLEGQQIIINQKEKKYSILGNEQH